MNTLKGKVVLFFTLLVVFMVLVNLQYSFAQAVSHFNKEDGLPSDLVKSVEVDHLGFIWLATDEGLIRFDGKNSKHLLTELPSPYVKFVFKRKNGQLLASTDMGLVEILNPAQPSIKLLLEAKSEPSEQYLSYPKLLYEDSQNTLWIADNWHIVALREGKFKHYPFPPKNKTAHFQRSFSFFEVAGRLFVFSNTGFLYRYEPSSDSFIEISYPQKTSNLFHAITMPQNKALFSASEGIFELVFDEKAQIKNQKLVKNDLDVSYLVRVDSLVYASSWTKGLFTINPQYEINEVKIPTNNVSNILYSNSTILLASDNGLLSLNKRTFAPQHQEMSRSYIQSFCQDASQVYYTDGNKLISSPVSNPNQATKLYQTTFGTLLGIGKRGNEIILSDTEGNILRFLGGRAEKLHNLSDKGKAIFSCFVDSKQRAWFCQDGNSALICLLPNNELKIYDQSKGISSNPLMVKESPDGVVYCGGTQDKGFLFALNEQEDRFENLSQKVNFEHNEPIIANDIAFRGKQILVGSSFGLLIYENGQFERKDLGEMTTDAVKALAVDKRQDIWLANSKGVLKLLNNEILFFDELQGLPSKGIAYRGFCVDSLQKLWVGTFNGLGLMQDTTRYYKTPTPILVSASTEPTQEGIYAMYVNNFLQVEYGVNILPQKQIRYQINTNGTWQDVANKTSLILSQLPVGDHTVRIRAKQSGNYVWSDEYSLQVQVKQVWYFTVWGATGIVLSLVFLMGLLVRLTAWHHQRNQKRLEHIIEMRTNDLKIVNEDVMKKNDLLQSQTQVLLASEEELRQNFEELQVIQEHLNSTLSHNEAITTALDNSAIVSVSDLKGKIIKVNQIFSEISGYSAEELLGQDHRIVNSGYHPKDFWIEMWKTITNGKTWRAEVCNRAKNGKLYWVDTVINPVYDSNGKVYQYLSIRSVITSRKQAEEKIQIQNKELQNNLSLVTKQHETIVSSINYALRIQNAIIPKEVELQKHLDCFVFFRPRDIVSGDFYWFADKGMTKVLALADCTGHGVAGAFMTMIANNILNQIVHDHEIHQPDEILNLMPVFLEKILLHSEGKLRDGMDISIVSITRPLNPLPNGEGAGGWVVSYAGAMNSLYYVQNQEFVELKADKVPIGGKFDQDFSYKKHEVLSDQGQVMSNSQEMTDHSTLTTHHLTLYLCSDGFQDQFGGQYDKKFMVKNLKKLLFEISEKPMAEQKQILEQTFEDWKGEQKQTDDVLVVGIRI